MSGWSTLLSIRDGSGRRSASKKSGAVPPFDLSQTILAVFGVGEIKTRTALHFGKNRAVPPFQTKEVQHVLLSM
jgi:hypothetical protein